MQALRYAWLYLSMTLCVASQAEAQAVLRLVLPECTTPQSAVWLEVMVELQPGQSLKTYDVRIPFEPAQLEVQESQIQQGSWFTAGGPTFFWHDIINNTLYVNGAILGPNLHVTGSGLLFRVPVVAPQPALLDLQASVHQLSDRYTQPLAVLDMPCAMQAPCTNLALLAHTDWDPIPSLHLIWNAQLDAQEWLQDYRVYSRIRPEDPWELRDSTTSTQWLDSLNHERRLYQVRARFTGAP